MVGTIIRGGIQMVTAAGVGQVIGNTIKATTPRVMSKSAKVLTKIGAFAIGGVVGELVGDKLCQTLVDPIKEKLEEHKQAKLERNEIKEVFKEFEETIEHYGEEQEAAVTADEEKVVEEVIKEVKKPVARGGKYTKPATKEEEAK